MRQPTGDWKKIRTGLLVVNIHTLFYIQENALKRFQRETAMNLPYKEIQRTETDEVAVLNKGFPASASENPLKGTIKAVAMPNTCVFHSKPGRSFNQIENWLFSESRRQNLHASYKASTFFSVSVSQESKAQRNVCFSLPKIFLGSELWRDKY